MTGGTRPLWARFGREQELFYVSPARQAAAPRNLVVILNWTDELKRLVPAN